MIFKKSLPIKRVVIAGCRDFCNYSEAKKHIDLQLLEIRKKHKIVIVSGCASGADALGERYAKENRFKVEKYPANWQKYGKSAGPIRNRQMAEVCDLVICFWDGKSRGTKSMIDCAKEYGKPTLIVSVTGGNISSTQVK